MSSRLGFEVVSIFVIGPHKSMSGDIIQIWHLGECNINFYCTLKNDIAPGACAEYTIIFQNAIIDIARHQSAISVLLYA